MSRRGVVMLSLGAIIVVFATVASRLWRSASHQLVQPSGCANPHAQTHTRRRTSSLSSSMITSHDALTHTATPRHQLTLGDVMELLLCDDSARLVQRPRVLQQGLEIHCARRGGQGRSGHDAPHTRSHTGHVLYHQQRMAARGTRRRVP